MPFEWCTTCDMWKDHHAEIAAFARDLEVYIKTSKALNVTLQDTRRDLASKDAEVLAVINNIPGAIRVREENGPENIYASLAVSVAKMAHDLAAARDLVEQEKTHSSDLFEQKEQLRNALALCAVPLEALRASECVKGATALAPEMQDAIVAATDAIRSTLKPAREQAKETA